MAVRIRKNTDEKKVIRYKRKKRIRSRLEGSSERPRVCIFRSNQNFYAQLVDDLEGKTLLSVSTVQKGKRGSIKNSTEGTKQLGSELGQLAKEKKISRVIFDRSGYLYHGKVKAFADGLRESGINV